MSLPLQIVIADPDVTTDRGQARFVWDDQPEPARRAARQARTLLELTGTRGEGGFARLVIGEVHIDEEPAPVVTLRLTRTALGQGALAIPEHVGARVLDARARLDALHTLLGLVADLAAAEHARVALQQLAAIASDGVHALAGAARLSAASLAEALALRMATQVAQKVAEARTPVVLVAPAWPELAIDPALAEPLGARVVADGGALARTQAALMIDRVDTFVDGVRRTLDDAFSAHGFAAVMPARALVEGLRRELEARRPQAAPIVQAVEPSRAPLDAAEHSHGELAADVRAWPLEAAAALGTSVLASAAIGPFITLPAVPGGGWTLVAMITTGVWIATSLVTRAVQAVARSAARTTLRDAEAAYADAWRTAARRWFEPIAQVATRRASLRLASALDHEATQLDQLAREVDQLIRRPVDRTSLRATTTFERDVDLGPARDVLAQPIEPLFRRVEGELKHGEWRRERPILRQPDGVVRAARASYAELAHQLPLASRTDVAEAIRASTRTTLAELRAELARWLPEGLPARRFVALPPAMRDASPEQARFDDHLEASGDAWLLALWRPA